MAPDPASSPVDAVLYFRCRKCRQLLFTDRDVLQHELGEGRASFQRQRRKRESCGVGATATGNTGLYESRNMVAVEEMKDEMSSLEEVEEGMERLLEPGHVIAVQQELESTREVAALSKKKEEECVREEGVLGGNPECQLSPPDIPWPGPLTPSSPLSLTPADVSAVRQEVASPGSGAESDSPSLLLCHLYLLLH